jgi:cytochrome P450
MTSTVDNKIEGETVAVESVTMPGNWLFGNARQFTTDPLGMMMKAAALGRIVRLRFLTETAFMLREPQDIKWVLVDNHRNYVKGRSTQALQPLLGQGLLNSEGEFHQQQRRLVQPAFHRQRIAAYAEVISRFAGEHMEQWRDEMALDLHEELMRLTMVIVAQCLFDVDVSGRASNLGEAITKLVEGFDFNRVGPVGQFIDHFDIARRRQRSEVLAVLDGLIYELIQVRRAEGADHGDLLSMLVLGEDSETRTETRTEAGEAGKLMSDKQVRDELLTLFLAGHETTALAVTYAFYLLAQNPAAEAKLLAELNSILGDPHSATARLPQWEDLPRLEYTRRVFAEAMRLYPPAYATARIARHDDEIAGCRIPARSTVIVSQYVTHRDPRFWSEPERFDPDRFSPEAEAQRPKFAYFPFGGGPRRCIGEPFAWMEGQLLIAALAHRCHIAVQRGYAPELQPLITLRARAGMPVIVKKR